MKIKEKLQTFSIHTIRSWQPCYDPSRHLPEDWSGNALDILKHPDIPSRDKAWVVCREGLISEKIFRLWAVWSAREALKLIPPDKVDPRSIAACDVAERYAMGEATAEELDAAWSAADAAWSAARSAADAAWSAADAAWSAADAAWSAARNAADAAWSAADAAWSAQIQKLIELIEAEYNDN